MRMFHSKHWYVYASYYEGFSELITKSRYKLVSGYDAIGSLPRFQNY